MPSYTTVSSNYFNHPRKRVNLLYNLGMKAMVFLMSLWSLSAWAVTWEAYLAEKRELVSHARHLPLLLTHGHKTARSVLIIHGAFSSPLHFRGMAREFLQQGHNVLVMLLPGHWEKNLRALDATTHQQWVREVDVAYELARALGDEVIIAGHSLGGLLALEQALKRPSGEIAALALFSPALKLWPATLLASRAGHALGLSGNDVSFAKPDGVRVPYFSTRVGAEIDALGERIRHRPVELPVFLAYTWNDKLVSPTFLRHWMGEHLAGLHAVHSYAAWQGVNHAAISTSPEDVPAYGHGTNPSFGALMRKALDFLDRQNGP